MNITVNSYFAKQTMAFAKTEKGVEGFTEALSGVFAAKGIDKQLGALGDPDLKGMYVHVTAHKFHLSRATRQAMGADEFWDLQEELWHQGDKFEFYHDDKHVNVPIGCNELPDLLDRLQKACNDGISLKDALLEQSRKYTYDHVGKFVDIDICDSFWVDTETGDIDFVTEKQRRGEIYCGQSPAEYDLDMTAALAIADDFATFMRYTFFRKESDDPAAVNALLEEIKGMRYNTARYIPLNDAEIAAHEKNKDLDNYFSLLEAAAEAQLDELLDMIDRHFGIVEEGLEMRENAADNAQEDAPEVSEIHSESEFESAGAVFFMTHSVKNAAAELASIV